VRYSTLGTRRKLTDEQLSRLLAWKPLTHVARECGVDVRTAHRVRAGYRHKKRSP
jgi:hypothetical protein